MKTILFYGALGHKPGREVGGGEAGNKKTIEILEEAGIKVERLNKPYPGISILSKIIYVFTLHFTVVRLGCKLLTTKNLSAVHISGFYRHLILQEYLLISISKLFGKKCIYELRGGGVEEVYYERTILYRFLFKQAIQKADVILSQGEKYITFLNKITDNKIVFYPNFIKDEYLNNKQHDNRNYKCLKLVYFGRLTPSKNIPLIIDIIKHLEKESKFDFSLKIIGSGEEEYLKLIHEYASNTINSNKIEFMVPKFGFDLIKIVKQKHFFLFPSNEPKEGHSNALTEAMALGVVPISSPKGFNREIVGTNDLILDNYDASQYAQKIIDIWENNKWNEYSIFVSNRIRKNFTRKRVAIILLQVYNDLLEN